MIDVTIQVDDAIFTRFKALCEALDIAVGDYIEGIVTRAVTDVLSGISSVLNKHLPDFQHGE